jgi:hypothetical protein
MLLLLYLLPIYTSAFFNQLNSTAGMNVVHNALYSKNYGMFAEKAGINYTTYYTDYHGGCCCFDS